MFSTSKYMYAYKFVTCLCMGVFWTSQKYKNVCVQSVFNSAYNCTAYKHCSISGY